MTRPNMELGTERARPLHSPREEEALEQQIRENEAARGDQTLEDEGVNSKSTENDPKNQWVKEVEEIEVTSGEIKIKETDGRGGEKMEEQRGDIPLPQGRWPEDRDIRLLNILGTAAHNLRGIKGRSVMGGKEVSRKEKWTGPEGISQEKTRIQDGPSNWMRPNSPQVQDNRSKEMIEGKSNDKGLSKPQYPINLIHPGQDTIRAQRGGDCQYDHPANPLSGPSKQEMEKEGKDEEWLIGRLRGLRIGAIGKGRHLYRIEHQTNQACRDPIRLLLCQSAAYLGIISIGACFFASGFQQPSFCESE
ncbi:hypothetical protein HN51_006364 [Arachis hypogaea]